MPHLGNITTEFSIRGYRHPLLAKPRIAMDCCNKVLDKIPYTKRYKVFQKGDFWYVDQHVPT
jgi:hypothetical protein